MSRHNLLRQPPRGSRRGDRLRNSLRLGGLFAVLLAINIYVFFFRGGTSINELMRSGSIQRRNAARQQKKKQSARRGITRASLAAGGSNKSGLALGGLVEKSASPTLQVTRGTLKGHNGLHQALAAAKLGPKQIAALIAALAPKLNLRALRPRHTFELHRDAMPPHRLQRFVFHLSPIKRVIVRRRRNGTLRARLAESKLRVVHRSVAARVRRSLGQAIGDSGESPTLLYRLINLFSWDINWTTDVRRGDSFRVIVEKKYLGDKLYAYGRLLAAEYHGKKTGRVRAFYFRQRNGRSGHYTAEGRSIRRPLLKTPLNFRRISSSFNKRRFHPVLHRIKAHLGVDYVAPPGTPVYAAGDGKVVFAKRAGPAGKMVQIRHASGIVSVYMHLLRFARGLKVGQKVKQRRVIGYVGATGRATGPHLHYGLKVRGRYIDPAVYKVPRGALLPRGDRARFLEGLSTRVDALDRIALPQAKVRKDGKRAPRSPGVGTRHDDDDLWS